MVTAIPAGASQGGIYPITLTDSNATYCIYLNGKIPEKWAFPPVQGTEMHLDTDMNIASQMGAVTGDFTVDNNKWPVSQTTFDNLKKALVHFASHGDALTLSHKLNGTGDEMMRWPAYSTLTMTAVKVRVISFAITDKTADVWTFTLGLRRFNTA